MTVSPKSASKGDRVTITVKPDSGYVSRPLTVTDKNGNELTLKDKGDGKYTFTMPAGKVRSRRLHGGQLHAELLLRRCPTTPTYEAVKWAVENGITTGVGNDLFAPEQPLHPRPDRDLPVARRRLSPEPKGAASGMTDVVSGSYYEKAVAWA